jgi:HTH-type transcriptional regulator / antitoxin HigA
MKRMMGQALTPARAVPPGEILAEELEARGWTQKDLAAIMGRPTQAINEIISATKSITPQTAVELAAAFGTSADLWLNLEANYQLHKAQQQKQGATIARKSRIYSIAPVAEMVRRGWISAGDSVDELEKSVCNFLGIASPDETPRFAVSFRQSIARGPEYSAQVAWAKRVENLASAQHTNSYDPDRLRAALPTILAMAQQPDDVARVPDVLRSLGVHFVIVPHLPKTYVDGAAWHQDGQPVVALTLRYDHIDTFWFTLMHELAHVVAGHSQTYVDNLDDESTDGQEKEANRMAADWLLDPHAYAAFVDAARPYFSRAKIEEFAASQGRHPGIIVGRLHHDEVTDFRHLNALLVKVKPFLKDQMDAPGRA